MQNPLLSLWQLLFPRRCVVCGAPISEGEEVLCFHCNIDMPRTDFHRTPANPMERMFWGKVPIVRAAAYFYYYKGSNYRHILYGLKYGGRKELGAAMGRFMATEWLPTGFFDGMDVIVPVPLHVRKQKERGYNQSEWIARGVSEVTSIPIDTDSLVRSRYTETQTHRSVAQRWDNVDGIFALRCPERFAGKHLLLLDDVMTTGSTLTACADALRGVADVRISIVTLAIVSG
ncbi:MAG: ComF family protein [Prevotellaceae bacterium]|jgi:ComF family protein|nr:ComF family protein [Prevotellaceae bacterium]